MNYTASLFVTTITALSSIAAQTDTPQFVALGDIAGGRIESVARKISPDGTQVIGTSAGAKGSRPFIWSASTGMLESDLAMPVYSANGIIVSNIDSLEDSTAGVIRTTAPTIEIAGNRPRILTTSPMEFELTGNTTGHTHLATAVSDNGQWILTVAEDSTITGSVWSTSPIEVVHRFDSLDGYADITNDGSTLGYQLFDDQRVPVILHGSGEEEFLSPLPPGWSNATPSAISNDTNTFIGQAVVASGGSQAFLWTRESGYQLLSDLIPSASDWKLINAVDISSDGSAITGYGRNASGHAEAWLVTLQPKRNDALTDWLAAHGLSIANLSGDSDIDGISDLLEFVFNTDPLRADTLSWTAELATAFATGETLSIPARPEALVLVNLRIEESFDLDIWEPVSADLQITNTSIQISFDEPVQSGNTSQFVRLAVELR